MYLRKGQSAVRERDMRDVIDGRCASNQGALHTVRKRLQVSTFEINKSLQAFAGLKCLPEEGPSRTQALRKRRAIFQDCGDVKVVLRLETLTTSVVCPSGVTRNVNVSGLS